MERTNVGTVEQLRLSSRPWRPKERENDDPKKKKKITLAYNLQMLLHFSDFLY